MNQCHKKKLEFYCDSENCHYNKFYPKKCQSEIDGKCYDFQAISNVLGPEIKGDSGNPKFEIYRKWMKTRFK